MTDILVVEDGTGVADANAYVSMDECSTYASDRGLTFTSSPSSPGEQSIIRATAALDGSYRYSYPGYRTIGRQQGLEWPRTAAYDYEGVVIDTNTVPIEVRQACCEIAIRELADPGSFLPDLERGGFIRTMKAGSVEIQYGGSNPTTVYTLIDSIMSRLVGATQAPFTGTSVRG